MSFSLSFSGHHNDAAKAAEIDAFIVGKGREIAAGIRELDPALTFYGSFGGPSQSVNFVAELVEAELNEGSGVEALGGGEEPTADG